MPVRYTTKKEHKMKRNRRNELRVQILRALYTRYSCDTTLNYTVIHNHKKVRKVHSEVATELKFSFFVRIWRIMKKVKTNETPPQFCHQDLCSEKYYCPAHPLLCTVTIQGLCT